MTITVLLADDQYLIQEGVKAILRDETEIEIVGTAKNGIEAIVLAQKLEPNIILLDIEMPKINGIEVAKHISELLPNTRIIMLSSHSSQKYITQALEAGASSYLLKDSFIGDLKQAIYSLSRGYSYMEAELLNQALDKIKANNIVNSQNQKTKIRKYRKSIYVPAKTPPTIQYSDTETPDRNQSSPEISKSSLAPIFNLSPSKIESGGWFTANLQNAPNSQTTTRSIYSAKRYSKKVILSLIAIASFVISLIIF